ncbi:MAG: hypothetical protein WC423_07770 [Vulcanimicrobiota bacterium]
MMVSFYTMKKDSRPPAFTLRNSLFAIVACLALLAWPALAISVGGTELNATDLGGGLPGGTSAAVLRPGGNIIKSKPITLSPGVQPDTGDEEAGEKTLLNIGFPTPLIEGQGMQGITLPGLLTISPDLDAGSEPESGSGGGVHYGPAASFGLVERRPDFQYRAGSREFQATPTYTIGQKGLGIGPGLGSNHTRYSPLGEF